MRLPFGLAMIAAFAQTTATGAPRNPDSATFNVTVTIIKQCVVTTPAAIVLGSIESGEAISSDASASGTFAIKCSAGTPYQVGFAGTNDLSAGSAIHQMKGTAEGNMSLVPYSLYDTTAGAPNRSALNGSASVISDTGTGTSQTKTMKAQVTGPMKAARPDVYTDTVTMAVTY